MAEKEERILVARSTDYTITDTDKGARFDAKIAPHCANVFTLQEAIRKMCDAYFKAKDKGLMESERVLAALNALLSK